MPLNVQCKRCANLRNDWCDKVHDSPDHDLIRDCQHYRTLTHADRIRSKSDEELAEFFGTLPCCPPGEDLEELCFPLDSCEGTDFMVKCWLDWLRQEGVADGV